MNAKFIGFLLVIGFIVMDYLSADQTAPLDSFFVEFKYANGKSVRVKKNINDKLEELSLCIDGKLFTVPKKYMENIINPNLSSVQLYLNVDNGKLNKLAKVMLEFDSRPYNWGVTASRVSYYFKGDKLEVKEMCIPIKKGEYKIYDEYQFKVRDEK